MVAKRVEAFFITKWKKEMISRIRLRFRGHPLNEKKIDKYLDKIIYENIKNPEVLVVNNYMNKQVNTDLLSLIDTIEDQQWIIGGGGTLYVQHDTPGRPNIMYDYITSRQELRGKYKKDRKRYEKDTNEWIFFDVLQNAMKVIINSLYGVHGYEGFILYNRFIAEATTNIGRQIITTAVMAFENFLAGGVRYNREEELYQHITNVCSEYDNRMDFSIFQIEDIDQKVIDRLLNICEFQKTDTFIHSVSEMIHHMEYGEKVLLYYKNNLYEFSRLPFIFDKLKYIVENLDELKTPEKDKIEDVVILKYIEEITEFYRVFVVYDYPIFDRVRKAMYTDRDNVLYVDTDSNFLGLNQWVTFVKEEVLEYKFNKSEEELDFICINLCAMFLTDVIDLALHTLCRHMNTTKVHADRLNMKNEYYISRIVFTDAKKRYINNNVLQEGKLLNNGIGLPNITGFDFKKATTKPYLREIYTKICEEDILRAEYIDVESIYRKVLLVRNDVSESVSKGESTFYKQSSVQLIEHYKEPYSTQGIVAVILWNTLNPTYTMELPVDCDIVPIQDLSGPKYDKARGKKVWKNEKFVMEFQERFPEEYARLDRLIYGNSNELIRNMGLTSIAKPRNVEIEMPEWFSFLIDREKVVLDAMNLISPILTSIGLTSLKTNASTEYISNIVSL